MSYNDFVKKYLGRYIDFDGSFGAQCTDLMRAFEKEVDGFSPYLAIPTRGNAKDIYRNFISNQYYKRIDNTPTGIPKQGDIIFWKTSILPPWNFGIAGHVAIVDSANVKDLICFSQNYPTGSPCIMRKFNYKDCLGWFTKVK